MDVNVWNLTQAEREEHKLESLPANLGEAIVELENSSFMRETLGDHVFDNFLSAKKQEWGDYISQVTNWEVERYLTSY